MSKMCSLHGCTQGNDKTLLYNDPNIKGYHSRESSLPLSKAHSNTTNHTPIIHYENNLTPNLTMCFPKTRGFKLAAINITSQPKHIG